MASEKVYQFKVTLERIRPPIWRRFQVNSDISFYELHQIIQRVMGWDNAHLHLFKVDGMLISDSSLDSENVDEEERLDKYVNKEKQKLLYDYDFGDSWRHDLLLEKILSPEPYIHYPRCVKGRRACPPEDCGGTWGYQTLLEAQADKNHPQHEMYMEWLGDEPIDPEAFDLDEINRNLKKL